MGRVLLDTTDDGPSPAFTIGFGRDAWLIVCEVHAGGVWTLEWRSDSAAPWVPLAGYLGRCRRGVGLWLRQRPVSDQRRAGAGRALRRLVGGRARWHRRPFADRGLIRADRARPGGNGARGSPESGFGWLPVSLHPPP